MAGVVLVAVFSSDVECWVVVVVCSPVLLEKIHPVSGVYFSPLTTDGSHQLVCV